VGGRPVTEQGVLRNLNKRKSARRGDDYDGAALLNMQQYVACAPDRNSFVLTVVL